MKRIFGGRVTSTGSVTKVIAAVTGVMAAVTGKAVAVTEKMVAEPAEATKWSNS